MRPVKVVEPGHTQLVIVGVGGTGGYVLQQAARLLYGIKARGGSPAPILLIDGDTVEEKNLLRQSFLPQDVGRNKADVLAERYGRAFGLEIGSYPRYLTADSEIGPTHPRILDEGLIKNGAVVVGCVDNAATRKILHRKLKRYWHVVYVDSGNSAVDAQDGGDEAAAESGWEGQVVAGVRFRGEDVLPFVGDVFPDMLEVRGDADKVPGDPTCGYVVVSNPQRLMTNLMAATAVLTYLHPLLSEGTLVTHRALFDARRGYVRSDAAIDAMLEVSA